MKHKYVIEKNTEQKQVTIKEFAELDKETLSFLCQETYAEEKIAAAVARGKEALIGALRTPNMYPSGFFANKIAEAVLSLYGPEPGLSSEIVLDDVDFISKQPVKRRIVNEIDGEVGGVEDLLTEDFEEDDDLEKKGALKNIDSPLKVLDNDYDDFDDEEK
ncbi:MAG: hypothetical protein JXB26_03700 [Candidatus Aminicenantes bacterium]|nr:hypothetical protein [Candidatus Aminicenantes bacterium]